jgi:elongation factor P
LPKTVVLEIAQCDPGERGNTAQGASKPATMSTGSTVNVPLFINEGDHIRVDTSSGKYTERVKV